MRYFYVTYTHDGLKPGYITVSYDNYPSLSGLKIIIAMQLGLLKCGGVHITNIIEFKNEQDYNDFVK